MSNRVVNKYGALDKDSFVAKEALEAFDEYERRIKRIIQTYALSPVEIRCLESALRPSVFAEETLRGALNMRKSEKDGRK